MPSAWFGPRGCQESCCKEDCALCHDCTDTAIPNPLSTYTSTCTTLVDDWIVDFKLEGWGDGDLQLVAGPVTATVKELDDGFGPYHRVDFPNAQNKLEDGCIGPTSIDTASPSFPIFVRIAYRTEEVTRGVNCVTTEIHESVTVSIFISDPCDGAASGSSVCQGSKYLSKPTGNAIELAASGTGSVVTKIRVMNRVVNNIPCVEVAKCFPCTISSGDIAHWKDLSVTVSGLPSGNSDPYGSAGTYLAHWIETKGWNHQCAATEADQQQQDFYCGTDYRLFTREVIGMGAMNGSYTPKLIDKLDPTEAAIPSGSEPADLLDATTSLCDNQRYFWLLEIPVVPVVVIEREQKLVCPGAFNELDTDETTVIIGYLRAMPAARHFAFFEVKRYSATGAAAYNTAISNGANVAWNLTEEVGAKKYFDTSSDGPLEENGLYLGPWSGWSTTGPIGGNLSINSIGPGEEVGDVIPTKTYMPVVSSGAEPFNKYWPTVRTLDLGKCDGATLSVQPISWVDVNYTRAYAGYHYLLESSFTLSPCIDKDRSTEIRNDPFSYTTIRTSDYDLEGGCV